MSSTDTAAQLQQEIVAALRQYLTTHPESKLTIIGNAAADEEIAVARERMSYVTRALGLPVERLERQTVKRNPVDYPELAEEQRCVQFLIDGVSRIVRVERTMDSTVAVSTLRIPVGHVISCDTSCTSGVTASLNGNQLSLQGSAPTYAIVLDSAALVRVREGGVINVRGNVAFEGYATSSSQDIAFAIIPDAPDVRYRMASNSTIAEPLPTLCYFEFNGSQVASVNADVLERVRIAASSGKTIEVVAGTDHLGTDNANSILAERRANAAVELIKDANIRNGRFTIVINRTSVIDNTTPMQRIANRSVRIRIID